ARDRARVERPAEGRGARSAEGAVGAGPEVGAWPRASRARTDRRECREQGGGPAGPAAGGRAQRERQRSGNRGGSPASDEVGRRGGGRTDRPIGWMGEGR